MRQVPWSKMLLTMQTKGQEKTESRRGIRRARVSQPVRVRPKNAELPMETCWTVNVSRNGMRFVTLSDHYFSGMEILVTRNFQPNDPANREETGSVLRVAKLKDGRWSVAIQIG
jgi:hypothetical protein